MKRALYERIQEHVDDLPENFRLNIPLLFATTSPETRQVGVKLLQNAAANSLSIVFVQRNKIALPLQFTLDQQFALNICQNGVLNWNRN